MRRRRAIAGGAYFGHDTFQRDGTAMKLSDLEKFEVISEDLMLGDRFDADGKTLTRVRVLRDKKTKRAYQVDMKRKEYREAEHVLGNYGEWKKLD